MGKLLTIQLICYYPSSFVYLMVSNPFNHYVFLLQIMILIDGLFYYSHDASTVFKLYFLSLLSSLRLISL